MFTNNNVSPSLTPDQQRAIAQTLLDAANVQEDAQQQIADAMRQINDGLRTLKRLKVVR